MVLSSNLLPVISVYEVRLEPRHKPNAAVDQDPALLHRQVYVVILPDVVGVRYRHWKRW